MCARSLVVPRDTVLRKTSYLGKERITDHDHAVNLSGHVDVSGRKPGARWHLGVVVCIFGRVR